MVLATLTVLIEMYAKSSTTVLAKNDAEDEDHSIVKLDVSAPVHSING